MGIIREGTTKILSFNESSSGKDLYLLTVVLKVTFSIIYTAGTC